MAFLDEAGVAFLWEKIKNLFADASASEIAIDTEMSDESENAVQNKVIKAYVDAKATGNGLSTEQINALDNMFKITAFSEDPTNAYASFKSVFGITDNTNNGADNEVVSITLSASTLTFDIEESQTLTATVTPTDVTSEVVWTSSNNAIATVENGVVTPVSDGSCTISATVENVSAQCDVIVAIETETITYTVNNYLTNVVNSNEAISVYAGQSYTAVLPANDGYAIDESSVVVTMNATEITDEVYNVETNEISITTVLGDISITASAVVSTDWDFEWDYSQGLMSENGFTMTTTTYNGNSGTEVLQDDGVLLTAPSMVNMTMVPTGYETIESGIMEITFIAQECGNHYLQFWMSDGESGCKFTMNNSQWIFGGAWAADKAYQNEYTLRIVFNKDGTHYLYADATSDRATKTSTVAETVTKNAIRVYHGTSILVKSVKYKWSA